MQALGFECFEAEQVNLQFEKSVYEKLANSCSPNMNRFYIPKCQYFGIKKLQITDINTDQKPLSSLLGLKDRSYSCNIILSICYFVKHMHSCGVFLRFAKSSDIFVIESSTPKIRIRNFQYSYNQDQQDNADAFPEDQNINCIPMAPELRQSNNQIIYLQAMQDRSKADVYLIGSIYYILLGGSNTQSLTASSIQLPNNLSPNYQMQLDVIRLCISQIPSQRPTIDELFKILSDIFSKIPEPQLYDQSSKSSSPSNSYQNIPNIHPQISQISNNNALSNHQNVSQRQLFTNNIKKIKILNIFLIQKYQFFYQANLKHVYSKIKSRYCQLIKQLKGKLTNQCSANQRYTLKTLQSNIQKLQKCIDSSNSNFIELIKKYSSSWFICGTEKESNFDEKKRQQEKVSLKYVLITFLNRKNEIPQREFCLIISGILYYLKLIDFSKLSNDVDKLLKFQKKICNSKYDINFKQEKTKSPPNLGIPKNFQDYIEIVKFQVYQRNKFVNILI